MTPTELRAEIDYRIAERLGILGFYDSGTEPTWAMKVATAEAHAWAKENHPETFEKLKPK